jgi:hypothetical protein
MPCGATLGEGDAEEGQTAGTARRPQALVPLWPLVIRLNASASDRNRQALSGEGLLFYSVIGPILVHVFD